MKKYYRIFTVAAVLGVLLVSCASVPDFTTFEKSLGVVQPVVMFGEKAAEDQDSENFQFTKTKSIAVQSNGNILVGGKHFGVSMFTADGEFIMNVGTIGDAPGEFEYSKGLAVDKDDNIYVGDSNLLKILVFDKDGNFIREFGKEGTPPDGFTAVGPICVDDEGNIYVSDKGPEGGALKFDNDGNFIMKIGAIGEGENMTMQAGYIAVNSRLNKLYMADDPNGQVDVYDSVTGDFLYEFGGKGEGPDKWGDDCEGIAIGPWDLVFAVDENGGNIKIFQEDGTFVTSFGKPGIYEGELGDSEGIAYDSANRRIVLADEKNYRVQSWSLESLGL